MLWLNGKRVGRRFQLLVFAIVGAGCSDGGDAPDSGTTVTATTATASSSNGVGTGTATATGSETAATSVSTASGTGLTVVGTDSAASSFSSASSGTSTTSTTVGTSTGGSGASGGPTTGAGGGGGMTTASASDGSAPDEPCSMPPLAPGNTTRTLEVGGLQRTFIVHVPESYTGTTRVPLVLDFHPLGGSGSQEQSGSGYQRVADEEGFLIAFADGIDNAWNIGPCCTSSRDVDDLGFALAMIDSIAADGCVDPKRIYSVGFSMGGGMSHYLACNAADVFAAVAPAAFDLLIPEEMPCTPARPISVLAFRGTNDMTVPFGGGLGPSGRVTFMGAEGSFERWAEINGCTASPTSEAGCSYYSECDGGTEVGLCVAQGGGHATGDANAGWEFLRRFTLP